MMTLATNGGSIGRASLKCHTQRPGEKVSELIGRYRRNGRVGAWHSLGHLNHRPAVGAYEGGAALKGTDEDRRCDEVSAPHLVDPVWISQGRRTSAQDCPSSGFAMEIIVDPPRDGRAGQCTRGSPMPISPHRHPATLARSTGIRPPLPRRHSLGFRQCPQAVPRLPRLLLQRPEGGIAAVSHEHPGSALPDHLCGHVERANVYPPDNAPISIGVDRRRVIAGPRGPT